MTTEKKKRLPKPPMTGEVQFLILLLPISREFSPVISVTTFELFSAFIQIYYLYWNEKDSARKKQYFQELKIYALKLERMAANVKHRLMFSDNDRDKSFFRQEACLEIYYIYKTSLHNGDKIEIEAGAAHALLLAFSGSDPVGTHYIGACPRCGKIFEKKQANAEYCGKSCANMDSRDRKKSLLDDLT